MPTSVALISLLWSASLVAADRPNVVIIYGDDVGFGDVGAYGAKLIPTPNIDRLASQGLVFTDGHCTAATCTPSRFSLLTGIHAFRHGVRVLPPNAPLKITSEMFTLPQLFKQAGYQTAVVGKWHLGLGAPGNRLDWNGEIKPGPLELGFDYAFLLPYTNDRVPCVYVEDHRVVNLDPKDPLFVGKKPTGIECTEYPDGRKNRAAMTYYQSSHGHNQSVINGIGRIGYQWGGKSALWNDETMTDEFVSRTRKWLKSRDTNKPFFLYFSAQDIHVPRTPHPRFRGKSKLTYRGDAMVQFDWAVGEITKMLDDAELSDNTIVIFTSDNGPVYDDGYQDGTTVPTSSREVDRGHDGSGPYRGGKYQIYEGGTRVPFIVRWPGQIKPGRSTALVTQIDFIASFANLLEVTLKDGQAIDSRDSLDALLGRDHRGRHAIVEEAGRALAVRWGPWKYIRKRKQGAEELYHLGRDIGEQKNVAKLHPTILAKMRKWLEAARDPDTGLRRLERHADALGDPQTRSTTVPGYDRLSIEGWRVFVSVRLKQQHAAQTETALQLIKQQLKTLGSIVRPPILRQLRSVPIFLSPPYPGVRPTAEYHPNAKWLAEHGRIAALHRSVELTNILIFEQEHRRMPMLMLHELAHAYHDQVLGFDDARIKQAYEAALKGGTYNEVARNNGKMERAYAMTNHREYFAESSEAFLGTNDFYPFRREELKQHDPNMERLLREIWGQKANSTSSKELGDSNPPPRHDRSSVERVRFDKQVD